MPVNKPRRPLLKLALFAGCGCFVALWVAFSLPCVWRQLTGVICPGCGMSRALLALLQGDIAAALHYHPMLWCVPVLVVYIWFDGAPFRNRCLNSAVLALLLGSWSLCYIIRLVLFLNGMLVI